ncbi:MAG TPA: M20/M25/M40 family metallo-hydrolase [Kofleriaceae bacterium]|nr:M20/M25/M40 family metallo-hydrolase [Kofleriaceae bacterium]
MREIVGNRSLHEWRSTNVSSPHVILMGHLDVVPALPGTEGLWTYPPWSGAIQDGFVYGRGALDDKSAVIAILEAVEQLLGEGHQPGCTIHLAFAQSRRM